jgi:flagellar hook-associated protein 1 FlgK
MGVLQAMQSALSGLRATQAGLDVVAQNIANADSVGYTRRVLPLTQQVSGETTTGVKTGAVQRMLDILLQRQLRLETAGAAYTDVKANYTAELDSLFGAPGSESALDTTLNKFTQALQGLVNDPGSFTARATALAGATNLAAQLNGLSQQIQTMRTNAEAAIASNVQHTNDLLDQLQQVNDHILAGNTNNAALLDQRDQIIDDLSRLMDVRVTRLDSGSVNVMTTGGLALFDGVAAVNLKFDVRNNLTPQSLYDIDPTKRTVGTIMVENASGGSFDVLSTNLIRSGEIAGLVELRDKILVEAQTQLDQLAAGLASALSDRTQAGTAVVGPPAGFDVDLTGLQNGNVITLDYIDTPAGTTHRVSFIRVEDPSQLPLDDAATADPNDRVFGISFGGGFAAAATQMQAAFTSLGANLVASNPGGSTIRIVDDGAGNTTDVTGLSAKITVTTLTSGNVELPFFVDGGLNDTPFTGSFEGGAHTLGFAQRIRLNPAITADASKLVQFAATTLAGDATRPQHLLDALTNTSRLFAPESGIGGSAAPYGGTISDFARRIVETQGANAQNAQSLNQGQSIVLTSLQQRFAETAGVNVDRELSNLVTLQTAYAANARVITATKEMMDLLLRL